MDQNLSIEKAHFNDNDQVATDSLNNISMGQTPEPARMSDSCFGIA